MTLLQALILGIIRGLTEFLPISSSAHLVVIPYLFNWSLPQQQVLPFNELVQLGTLAAVIIYFWQDLVTIFTAFFKGLAAKEPFKEFEARVGWFLILATIPAGILGMTIKGKVDAIFANPTMTALCLFGTAALLVLADLVGKRTRTLAGMTWLDALWIGVFQAISIFPGISRSGAAIAGGMTRQFDRSSSTRFSFLMAVPMMIGASVVSLKDLFAVPNLSSFITSLLLGFFAAAVTGYLSIHWMLGFIKRRRFFDFAVYCVILACTVLLVGALRTNNAFAAVPTLEPTTSFTVSPNPMQGTNNTHGTPIPTTPAGFQIINVNYTPAVDWLIPIMSSCADVIGNAGLVTHEVPTASLDSSATDLLFRWGAPSMLNMPANQIGIEKLMLLVNNDSPIAQLNAQTARNLFSGFYSTWGDLYSACPDCLRKGYDTSLNSNAISLGFYPKDEDIQQLFSQVVMGGRPVASSTALLIPDPQAMVEFLQGDKSAIGFIPAHVNHPGLREINLLDFNAQDFHQPLLALSNSAPTGPSRELLLCMQKVLNP